MNNKFSWKNFNLLPKKQQRAVYTLIFSLVGFLLVVLISSIFLFSGGKDNEQSSSSGSESESTSSSSSDTVGDPLISDEFDGTTLEEAENTDKNYLKETLFIGDSNTERMMQYGVISIDNFVGKSGLSITGASTETCVYFKNDQKSYTIPQGVAKMKPRRVVITLGTNDSGESMTADAFVKSYESFVKSVQDAYPHCDIIINSILPVAKNRSYKNIDMDKINDFNIELAKMAKEKGYKFLNSSQALRGTDGYGKATYFTKEDGIHIVEAGARVLADYVRTHPYVAEDRRPDTKDIPTRRPAPSTTPSSSDTSSSSSSEPAKQFTATYGVQVDNGKAMGYLKSDKFENKTSYTHTFTDKEVSFTITAVAGEGYVFDSWSDGGKEATRTDKTPTKENIKLTAKFKKKAALSLKVDKESSIKATVGDTIKFTATVTGDGADAKKVVWKKDGTVIETAASCSVKFSEEGTFKIAASYTGVADPVTITVKVSKKTEPITISVSGPTTAKVGGGTLTYTATVTGTGADAKNVQWTVGGKAAGTGASITYTPETDGTVKIVASLSNVSKELTLTVSKADPPPVAEVKISINGPTSAAQAASVTYNASVENAKGEDVEWFINGNPTGSKGISFSTSFVDSGTYTVFARVAEKDSNIIQITIGTATE